MAAENETEEILSEVPETEPVVTGARHEFPCDNCGARMAWDPDADALSCEYCGAKREVPQATEEAIVERALEDAGQAARGFGLEVRVTHCENCGARVTFDEVSISEACIYCGSANVLAQEANRNQLKPESLLALDVSRDEVQKSFEAWIKGLWFRPNALKQTKRFDATGIYVPFWTFDCHTHSDWTADAGYYYYVTQTYVVMVNGRPQTRTRQVRKVRWVPAWGDRDDVFDDLLINASKGLDDGLVEKLGGFDTGELVAYKPEYLAGWRAEEYQVDLEQGWEAGQERVVEIQRSRCSGDVPGDTQRSLRVRTVISDVRWKHILLPLWSLQYRFGGKTYTVLVNGQTGRVVGRAPLSWVKILLAVLAVGVVAATVIVIVSAQ